jgi:PAS domain S-box-containing protein
MIRPAIARGQSQACGHASFASAHGQCYFSCAMSEDEKLRAHEILVIDPDPAARARLFAILSQLGAQRGAAGQTRIRPIVASTFEDAAKEGFSRPVLVLLDLRGASDGRDAVAHARARFEGVPIVVMGTGRSESETKAIIEAGADDVIEMPVREAALVARVQTHLRLREHLDELEQKRLDAHFLLELTQALASSLDIREILFTVVRRIADMVHVSRASIVLAPERGEGDVGYVIVASDDQQLSNLRIDLSQYPEIRQVLRTGEPLTVADVATHPILDAVRDRVPSGEVVSMTLLPISWQNQVLGALFLRATSRRELTDRELELCRIVTNATAVALRNARVMRSLRDHTQQVTFARFEAERRVRSLKRYADLFDSLSEGLAVLDADGHLLFANPRAFDLVALSDRDLKGSKIKDLIHPDDRKAARAVWDGFAKGIFPKDLDIRIRRGDGNHIIASVTTSSLLHGEGAVLVAFRDVTESRRIEAELVRTKEFLESLIEASVDGIVASDLKGTVLLFNRGAERIYGYRAEDVVGKLNVRELYVDGVARQVMRMLRSPQHGGVGRLENVRIDAKNAAGDEVPISLSAAMIFQDGKPAATFGIFTDLRDRLHIEERLAQAQQKLAVTEKQALIAELAGTAAHELNQPLTSVMGYAELLKRKLTREGAEYHAADIIVRESERMADIVRKIGKITKYETKSYVGGQRILDLDKASGDDTKAEKR